MNLKLLILCLAYSIHSNIAVPKGVYYIALDAKGRNSLYWTFNRINKQEIQFELHLPLKKSDWFAVGFSDYGDLYPADYCLLWTDWKGHTSLQDVWVDGEGKIWVDQQQDCNAFRVQFLNSVVKFTFSRKFDTCNDRADYLIEDGTTHIVWMKGTGPLFKLTGINVNDAVYEHGMQRTQLLKNHQYSEDIKPANTQMIDLKNDHVHVSNSDTTYWCHVFKLPEYLSTPHHVIQFESIIQSGNEGLVHHIEVFHCETSHSEILPAYEGPCFNESRPKSTEVCKKVLAAWAMGATPFVYPKETGVPIGGKDFNPFVMLEVHYNNPELKNDWIDSSGMRLYVTPSLRKFNAGVIELGLEYTDKMAIPPEQTSFTLSGYCISECTAVSIPPDGITIFGSQLHTHLTGKQVYTRHIRDGKELSELNRDNHYSTHFQEIRLLKRPITVLPGDALITSCRYSTEERENVTLGGYAIKEEMCVNYIHYYPKIELEVCKSSISDQNLETYFRYMKEWKNEDTSPEYGFSTNYENIDWTSENANELAEIYRDMTLSMQCNSSAGHRFPGNWENVPLTTVSYSLPPPIRNCKQA